MAKKPAQPPAAPSPDDTGEHVPLPAPAPDPLWGRVLTFLDRLYGGCLLPRVSQDVREEMLALRVLVRDKVEI